MAKHTPGPWVVKKDMYGWRLEGSDSSCGISIAFFSRAMTAGERGGYGTEDSEVEANVRLAAKAPDMQKEIKRLRAEIRRLKDILKEE